MADDDGKISGVEKRYYLAALELKGHLYDTKPPSGCNHGALPASEFSREQNGLMITQYFAERAEDEDKGAPLGFTNMQFLYRIGKYNGEPHHPRHYSARRRESHVAWRLRKCSHPGETTHELRCVAQSRQAARALAVRGTRETLYGWQRQTARVDVGDCKTLELH